MNLVAVAREIGLPTPRRLRERIEDLTGGRPRTQVVATLAGVLALSAADTAAVGAAGPQLPWAKA